MSWRKYLLIPQLSLYGLAAPRDQRRAWERYWSRARGTGVRGDMLWDADQAAEVDAVTRQLRDPPAPIMNYGS